MLDDIRPHAASPSAEELAWLSTDPVIVAFRVAALAVIALSIGILASDRNEGRPQPTPTTSTATAEEPRS